MKEILDVRQPIVEGLFYPEESEAAEKRVKELLQNNPSEIKTSKHLIVPHGGWDFVGDYIALGFNSLKPLKYKKVIIISNVHREFENKIILPDYKSYLINNNKITVDKEAIKHITKKGKKVEISNIPHMEEHGIETLLPFISYLYPNAKIVPILLGKTIVSLVRNLTNIINEITDDDTLVIVSSNFSDYRKEEEAKKLGKTAVNLTREGKLSELVEETRTNRLKTCGAGAIASLILLKDYREIKVLKEGLSKGSPLSGGRGTYYGTIGFLN